MPAVGLYLATHPKVGGWTGTRPTVGLTSTRTSQSHHELIRTEEGIEYGKPVVGTRVSPVPQGTVIGTAECLVRKQEFGWPRRTREVWTVETWNITPTAEGPPADDERAWRAAFADAINPRTMGPPPVAILGGEPRAVVYHPAALVLNAGERLWRAPLYFWGVLGVSVAGGFVAGGLAFRNRARPGDCPCCGYNLKGLARGVCPECGEAIDVAERGAA